MSSENESRKDVVKQSKEDKTNLILGIITLIIVAGIFVALVFAVASQSKIDGKIIAEEEIRRGNEYTFVYKVEAKDGESVCWYVNGTKVAESVYQGGEVALQYTPSETGTLNVQARVGKRTNSASVEVLRPQLTCTAPDLTVTYGDKITLPQCSYCGFVDGDCETCDDFDGCCVVLPQGKLNAGTYEIDFADCCEYKDYDMNYVKGTLTVLPKTLSAEIVKEYDGTVEFRGQLPKLSGVADGDDVKIAFDRLVFDSKNAGTNKAVTATNLRLEGKDCKNYCLDTKLKGKITPKQIELQGLTVADKNYDGTTKATVEKIGSLSGVVNGDNVAVGSITVRFADANKGEKQIVATDAKLVGYDKDNYTLKPVVTKSAKIK